MFHQDIQTLRSGENTTSSKAILIKYDVLRQPVKHCLDCLIYPFNQNKNLIKIYSGEDWVSKPLSRLQFLCFNLMNYE